MADTSASGADARDGLLVGAAAHGAFGGEHRHASAHRRGAGGARTRLDHADHGQPGVARPHGRASAAAEAVLQATTRHLMSRATSTSAACSA